MVASNRTIVIPLCQYTIMPIYHHATMPLILVIVLFPESTVTGEVLSLPPVNREDMGSYLCIAQNGVPPTISKSYKLIVNCKCQEQNNIKIFPRIETPLDLQAINVSEKPSLLKLLNRSLVLTTLVLFSPTLFLGPPLQVSDP